jgi:hypothetical protein
MIRAGLDHTGGLKVTGNVPVAVLPAGSVIVIVGSDQVTVPVQVTSQPSEGLGIHTSHGIDTVLPLVTAVQVTVTGPLVGSGTATQDGTVGGVVSNVTGNVPVAVLPAGSVIVIVGSDQVTVPVQVTSQPSEGLGIHTSHGIDTVSPLVTAVQVTVTGPLVGSGTATQDGTVGGVVSNVTGNVPVAVLPAGSVIVIVGSDQVTVPVQVTSQPSEGLGIHTSHGIDTVSPLVTAVQVTVTGPLVGSGTATQDGTVGGVVSNVTGNVPVAVLPAGSVIVIVGSDQVTVPVQVTSQPSEGLGIHTSHGIDTVLPLVTAVQVTVTGPLVGSGTATQDGTVGGVVSNVTGNVPVAVLPAGSVIVIVGSDQVTVPVQVTSQPSEGLGIHTSHGIDTVLPLVTAVQVTVTGHWLGLGLQHKMVQLEE